MKSYLNQIHDLPTRLVCLPNVLSLEDSILTYLASLARILLIFNFFFLSSLTNIGPSFCLTVVSPDVFSNFLNYFPSILPTSLSSVRPHLPWSTTTMTQVISKCTCNCWSGFFLQPRFNIIMLSFFIFLWVPIDYSLKFKQLSLGHTTTQNLAPVYLPCYCFSIFPSKILKSGHQIPCQSQPH